MKRMMLPAKVATIAAAFLVGKPTAAEDPAQAHATFVDGQNENIGQAVLTQTPNGVLIEAHVSGLSAGEHAFHIHGTGVCDPETGFKSANGHYDPRDEPHGFKKSEGPHAGDMPNQFASENGRLRVDLINDRIGLGDGDASLFDDDGSAIVIHAGADYYESQPSGAAGSRVACAVIKRG